MSVRQIFVERLRQKIKRGIGWLFGPMPPPVQLPGILTTAAVLIQPTNYLAMMTQPGNYQATRLQPEDYGATEVET